MKIINEKTGKPPKGYTNSQWQKDFANIREVVEPSKFDKMRKIREIPVVNTRYHGRTQYQNYCNFINDILLSIRNGEPDYCYYIYQVAELLKYEHSRLKAEWMEEYRCFKISLQ